MYSQVVLVLPAAVALAVVLYGRTRLRAWLTLLAVVVAPVVILIVGVFVAFSNLGNGADRILSGTFMLLPAFGMAVAFMIMLRWTPEKERFSLRPWIAAGIMLLVLIAVIVPSFVTDYGIDLSWFFEVRSGSTLTSYVHSSDRALDDLAVALLLLALAIVVSRLRSITRPLAYGCAAVFAVLSAYIVQIAADGAEGETQIDFGYTRAEIADVANFIHIAQVGYGMAIALAVVGAVFAFLAARSGLTARS